MNALKMLLALLVFASASGCVNRMQNDDIISEAIKCERVNLPWKSIYNYDGTVKMVICTPNGDKDVFRARG